jgi:hypothetical protein
VKCTSLKKNYTCSRFPFFKIFSRKQVLRLDNIQNRFHTTENIQNLYVLIFFLETVQFVTGGMKDKSDLNQASLVSVMVYWYSYMCKVLPGISVFLAWALDGAHTSGGGQRGPRSGEGSGQTQWFPERDPLT